VAYTAEDVKRLREVTAAGMLDCKKALDESGGDFDKAVEIIRVKGQKGVTKREGRTTSNGLVAAKAEGNTAVMLELNCETDFVAKGDRFQAAANELLEHLFASKISDVATFTASKLASGKTVQEHGDGDRAQQENHREQQGDEVRFFHRASHLLHRHVLELFYLKLT